MKVTMRAFCALRRLLLVFAVASAAALPAHAQLKIEVTSGVTDPVPIAVVAFARAVPADGGPGVIQHDLSGSGRFRVLTGQRLPNATPTRADDVVSADFKNAGADYVVVGRVSSIENGQLAVDFDLVNSLTGQRIVSQRFVGASNALRNAAHRVSDVVFEKITGIRGAFATRIAYVAVDGQPPTQNYQLVIADADGENQRLILQSRFPLMSPAWSPDGQWISYVSFESKRSAVYVQLVRTGERRQVSARAGINGAPAWSPDGKKLALTLTRITDDPAVDTEPTWTPDGKSVYFTSDRAGGPQIYRIGVSPGDRPKRITFSGNYNARPRLSPDGTQLAMVTLDSGNYRIAVQDIASGTVRVLSHGHLDESPSFAPNGAMLMYAEREGNLGSLASVSVDGLTGLRLKAQQGEVREPAWGPFVQ